MSPAEQYFSRSPSVASRPATVTLTLPDATLNLATDRGVFSADGVDAGTKLLLMDGSPPPADARELVDVGCGYGPIACVLALRHPDARVWAVDVNERARRLCTTNAGQLKLANLVICAPEDVPEDLLVDGIYSNPPIRIGKVALHELLLGWLGRLSPGGRAGLVVHRHLGADSLQRWLQNEGYPVVRATSRGGYRLLDVASSEEPSSSPAAGAS